MRHNAGTTFCGALLALTCLPLTVAGDTLKITKTDRVGRIVENQYFVADLSARTVREKHEDSGTLRALTYKDFDVKLLRTENRMHWAPNLSRVGSPGYSGLGTWEPVQEFREEQKGGEYLHQRQGYFGAYPEIKVDAEYRFLPGVPYFLFWSRLTVEKPVVVRLLRNNEMTMDQFFTHLAWPSEAGKHNLTTFDERHALIEKAPIPQDVSWLAFLNLEKGYGYGFVMLESRATKLVNAGTGISDGAENGKYWSRRLISRADTPLTAGDQFEERSAYVLFRCSKAKPLEEYFAFEKQIRQRFGGAR
jgi:hypothetical protein